MIEIWELVIEARVVDDAVPSTGHESQVRGRMDEAQLIDEVTRRVLMILNEKRERF